MSKSIESNSSIKPEKSAQKKQKIDSKIKFFYQQRRNEECATATIWRQKEKIKINLSTKILSLSFLQYYKNLNTLANEQYSENCTIFGERIVSRKKFSQHKSKPAEFKFM